LTTERGWTTLKNRQTSAEASMGPRSFDHGKARTTPALKYRLQWGRGRLTTESWRFR